MSEARWLERTERWLRALLRLYPRDFREEMGEGVVEAYRDRARDALRGGGVVALMGVWVRAFFDSVWNGMGERVRPAVGWRRTGRWGRDAELAVRRLARAPVFVGSMVGTLTVGLGAFAVVYAVVDKVLLEPLPYEDPEDLYFVWRDYGWFDLDRGWLGGPDVTTLREAGGPIQAIVGMQREMETLGTGTGEVQEVAVMFSEPNLLDVLGARPMLGRDFAPEEVGPGRPAVAILGHALWAQRFGADPDIVGKEIRLSGTPYTVIGVMGPDFRFLRHSSLGPPEGADLYATFDVNLAEEPPGSGSFAGMVRARPGTSPEELGNAVAAVGRLIDERDFDGQGLDLYPVGMKEDLVARVRPALLVLGIAGAFLVLVLMVNLATLLLVRAAQREREFAISRALGANRIALVRAILLEGGLLGVLGGIGGVLAAIWGTRVLVALAPLDLPRRESIAVDAGAAALVIGVGALLGLIAGAVPATWVARARLSALLSATAVRGGGGHGRLRRSMVVVQVALSLVLLSAGGLVVRSFEQVLRSDPGFDPRGVLTFSVPITSDLYPEVPDVLGVQERIHAALEELPGVDRVGAVSALPLTADASQNGVSFPGAPGNTGEEEHDIPLVDRLVTRPGYFEAMEIPLLAGRGFRPATGPEGPREVVIDRTLAQIFFPSGNPVGTPMVFGDDTLTVVGVAEHARLYDLHRDDRPQIYLHSAYFANRGLEWTVRTERDPMDLASEVRAAVWQIDPGLAVSNVQPMDRIVSDSIRQERLSAVLIAGFALGALLLAAMGLFGVIAGSVTRRRHELAIRLALGAAHQRVLRLVLGEGALLVFLGILLGVPGIYLAGKVLTGILVGISPFDPATLGAVAAGLAAVAILACYLPARRVTEIEPARLLRQE